MKAPLYQILGGGTHFDKFAPTSIEFLTNQVCASFRACLKSICCTFETPSAPV